MGLSRTAEQGRAKHLGPERRRPAVLDAALGVLLERGYEGASMAVIAEAVGVSKPVVYDCYPSKEELFKALFQREEARVMGEIRSALPALVTGDAERAMADAYTALLRAVAASPEIYRLILLGEGGLSAGVARRVRAGRAEQVAQVTAIVERWLEVNGATAEVAPRLVGYAIVALAEGGARALLDEDGWTPETLGPALGRLAARGIA